MRGIKGWVDLAFIIPKSGGAEGFFVSDASVYSAYF